MYKILHFFHFPDGNRIIGKVYDPQLGKHLTLDELYALGWQPIGPPYPNMLYPQYSQYEYTIMLVNMNKEMDV